jgi:hypothetical protein
MHPSPLEASRLLGVDQDGEGFRLKAPQSGDELQPAHWTAACDEAIQEMITSFQQRFSVTGKPRVETHCLRWWCYDQKIFVSGDRRNVKGWFAESSGCSET